MRDIFQEITDRIAAQLEQGARPWSKPWDASAAMPDLPRNFEGKPYRGGNVFWLWATAQAMGYSSPVWLTFKKAKERGASVRKGEKGTPVFFWKIGEYEDKKTGETRKSFMVRQYTVFNADQCDGLELPAPKPPRPEPERIAAAEELIAATGATVRHGGSRAFYSPSTDHVQMPPRNTFHDADGYYSTHFHELGHWTGHESRLAREFGKRFGDDAYAFEELVAELTAAFVCASQGFANVDRADHASYIAAWLRRMKDDPKAFVTAAGAAQKAADLILGTAKAEEAVDPVAEAA